MDDERPEIATNEEWRVIMLRARKAHTLTQEQLGAKVGTSQEMISQIESGTKGASTFILPICRVLSIPAPQHFIDDWQKDWSQLGHVLRRLRPEQAAAARRLVESMVKEAEDSAQREPSAPEPPEGRK